MRWVRLVGMWVFLFIVLWTMKSLWPLWLALTIVLLAVGFRRVWRESSSVD